MKILIEHGKHGLNYWNIGTKELFFATCLKLLQNRVDHHYIYPPEREPKKPNNFVQVNGEFVLEPFAHKVYLKHMKAYEEELATWNETLEALKNQDGRLAYDILNSRCQHDHERIEICDMLNALEKEEKENN